MNSLPAFAPPFALLLVTMIGLVLRTVGIGLDLWIDEIATLDSLRAATWSQLLTSYTSANNHVLNSVLVSASIGVFGEHEWSVRLPAMLFGVASIPVLYCLAGLAGLSGRAMTGAALILALSYHHIWFSQNARGYTAYVFFSLLGTVALVRLLQSPSRRWQAIFVAASAFNFLALLPSACVFGAQAIAAAASLSLSALRGEAVAQRAIGVALALAAAAAIAALIFAPVLVEMLTVLARDAPAQVTAYRLWSIAFVRETVLGLLGGLAPVWLAPLGLLAAGGAWGLVILARQAPVITGVLVGTHVLLAGAITVLGWPIYPRLFALGLPLAILIVLAAADAIDTRTARWSLRCVLPLTIALAVIGSLALIVRTYDVPKQQYRAALAQLARMGGPDSTAIAVGVVDRGISYYWGRTSERPMRIEYARTAKAFSVVRAKHPGPRTYLVSTFNGALAAEEPGLWTAMQAGWQPVVTLSATVRGGELTIWAPAATAR